MNSKLCAMVQSTNTDVSARASLKIRWRLRRVVLTSTGLCILDSVANSHSGRGCALVQVRRTTKFQWEEVYLVINHIRTTHCIVYFLVLALGSFNPRVLCTILHWKCVITKHIWPHVIRLSMYVRIHVAKIIDFRCNLDYLLTLLVVHKYISFLVIIHLHFY